MANFDPHTPWMPIARAELGVMETPGPANTARIADYHATTRGPKGNDKISWCSSFLNFCITKAGLVGTNRRLARSWLTWGQPMSQDEFRPGCVVVFKRAGVDDGVHGHVAFGLRIEGTKVVVLGGNQSNRVCEKAYPLARVLGYRWRA